MHQIPFLSVEWERVPDNIVPDDTLREIDGVLVQRKITIQVENIPAYPILRGRVHEPMSPEVARRLLYFVDDPTRPLPSHKKLQRESIHLLKSIYTACNSTTEQLCVTFADRSGLGRWYANNDSEEHPRQHSAVGSILRLPRIIKSTLLTQRRYSDVDLVKSHPTLMCAIANLCGIPCPGLEQYVLNYDLTVASMAAHWTQDPHNPVTKDDIKGLINRTVYGGGLKQWMTDVSTGVSTLDFQGLPAFSTRPKPLRHMNGTFLPLGYRRIQEECQKISAILYRSNPDIKTRVCTAKEIAEDDNKCQRRVVSYAIQTLEHFITYNALQHCIEHNYIPSTNGEPCFIWGYDGFSWVLPDGVAIEQVVREINTRVRTICGDAFAMISFIDKSLGEVVPEALDDTNPLWSTEHYAAFDGKFESNGQDLLKLYESISKRDYRYFKTIFERTHFKVLNKPDRQYAREKRNDRGYLEQVTWFTPTALRETYSNMVYRDVEEVRGKEKVLSKVGVNTWFNDPSMRMYANAHVYPPPLQCPPSHFNLWTESPFHDIPLRPGQSDHPRAVEAFMFVLKVICGEDQPSIDYFTWWIAHMIQRPGEKIGIALALGGSEGVGKTLLCYFIERMVGRGRYIDTKLDNVVGSFNHLLENRILVVINELGKKLTGEQSDALKALITDSELSLQNKGVDQRETLSYHRVIVTTNNPGAIDSSRRPFYVKATCEIKLSTYETKKELWDLTANDDAIAALYRYFQHLPIPHGRDPPNNELNREFRASRDPMASFALYLCDIAFVRQESADLSSTELHTHYLAWCQMEGMGVEWESRNGRSIDKDLKHKYSWSNAAIGDAFTTHGGRVQKRTYNFERIRAEINHVF